MDLDKKSNLLYRQHGDNVIGNIRIKDRIIKSSLFSKNVRYKYIKELYDNYNQYISNDKKKILKQCIVYKKILKNRILFALFNPLKPNNILERIVLFISIIIKKF